MSICGFASGQRFGRHAAEFNRDVDGLLLRAEPEARHIGILQDHPILIFEVLEHGDIGVRDPQHRSRSKDLPHSAAPFTSIRKLVSHLSLLHVPLQHSHLHCNINYIRNIVTLSIHLI